MKLTVELVPTTSHYDNVRTNVKRSVWDKLRKASYEKAGHKCEICGEVGKNDKVECHEIWNYNDETLVQKLEGLITLCPTCHSVKHIGRTQGIQELHPSGVSYFEIAIKKVISVNAMTPQEVSDYFRESARVHRERSKHQWELDILILDDLI
jgi:hypothetical protein